MLLSGPLNLLYSLVLLFEIKFCFEKHNTTKLHSQQLCPGLDLLGRQWDGWNMLDAKYWSTAVSIVSTPGGALFSLTLNIIMLTLFIWKLLATETHHQLLIFVPFNRNFYSSNQLSKINVLKLNPYIWHVFYRDFDMKHETIWWAGCHRCTSAGDTNMMWWYIRYEMSGI